MIKDCEILLSIDLPEQLSSGYSIQKLVGDASTRSYYRITTPASTTLVLMRMPEPFDRHNFPYLDNYYLLRNHDVPMAEIYAMKPEAGLVMLQDLGDETFYELNPAWTPQSRMYYFVQSLDILVRIGRCKPANPLAFDTAKFSWELNFFLENFLLGHRGCEITRDQAEEFKHYFHQLSQELAERPRIFCHRDYHSRNLMESGGQIYVIDFQDARYGPATYDLASLCYDSYIQHSPQMIADMERYYFTFHPDAETQRWEYPRMCLQRNLKALGTFGYQAWQMKREFYLQFVGPTLGYVRQHLSRLPEYADLGKLLARHLPELSPGTAV